MSQILLSGVNLNELLERIGQIIEKKISDLHSHTKTNDPETYITRNEVSKLLKISLPTLHEWTKLGHLQAYRIGTRVLYRRLEIDEALNRLSGIKFRKGGRYAA